MTESRPQHPSPACCLCGLLCPLPMKWPDHDEPPACSRLHSWLNLQDARAHDGAKRLSHNQLQTAAERLRSARRPLIWLESVDVQTTRAAVQLAQTTGATLHVAQSPGAERVAMVSSTDGWLGTTLAEVGSTASLVIHVGQQHLRDAPMFELRFANPEAQHLFLGTSPLSWSNDSQLKESIVELGWPKDSWLDGLSRTLLVLRDESAALARRADAVDADVGMLAEMLLGSHYTAIVWSEDELSDELDSLIVRRLLELARQVTGTARCSLLSLPQDPGRVTAQDAILWLTNRTTPLRYVDHVWVKDRLHHRSLQQWQQAFDWIVCVRNLPSDRLLPDLPFDLLLDAHCNAPAAHAKEAIAASLLPVRAVGLESGGHLLRADHGLAAMIHGVAESRSPLPSAAEMLRELEEHYRVAAAISSKPERT